MKKLKEIWFVIWDEETLIALVSGIIGVGSAFGTYKLYTLLPSVTSTWQTFFLWIKILFCAITALIFIIVFIVTSFRCLDKIADVIKYDNKEDAKAEEDKNHNSK
jgi:uncharacterized membrane protein